ncbi:putative O-glycosylation ligase, exosortase A system-associated [Azoarcus sp. DD4]|uniref:putative O-glycosylation ligase, exosortase A system-associated n=1 Tax=Azoarcus sp. DD4 TaxID=2027405 RepID=UPI00112EF7CC|nr:putative O-glycosylation ligase, exosortase A system-associated [Azoarcus sp. DD4]QDF98667.1 putative O-glycosylation ligase, exosortase A system-associated [Azoarcus sp. DD4]
MDFRDVFVAGVVLVSAAMALKRPWIGVMLWTWLSVMSPHRYTWGFAHDAPLAAIAAGATLAGLLMTAEKQSPFHGTPVRFFAVFTVWMTISWLLGVDPVDDYWQWNKVIKVFLMTFVALALLHNKIHIMAFGWVTAGSLAILGAKGGVFTIAHGGSYRVWGPEGSFIEDNNEFALALIITIPLLHFLQLQVKRAGVRHLISIAMLLCVASALGSHSRGGFLAMIAMGAMFWWRSPRKGPMGVLIAFVMLAMLPMMPEEWWARMNTISEYEQDGSAMGRINAWHVAFQVALHNFFGGGMSYQYQYFFSLYGVYNQNITAAHSIYFQILGNHGFVGLVLYVAIWIATYRYAGWLRIHARSIPQAKWAADLGGMVQVGLVGFAAGGAFLSLAYFDLPYNMMVMVVLAKHWVETRGWEREPKMSFLEYAGLRRKRPEIGAGPARQPAAGGH